MIKELILSLALSAASSVPFLDSPKRVQDRPDFSDDIIFGAGAEYNDNYQEYEAYNDFYSFFLNTSSREQGTTDYQDEIDNDDYLVLYWWDISSATGSCYCDLYFSFADQSDANEARALMAQHTLNVTYNNCENDGLSTYTLGNVEYLPNEPGYRYRFEVYLEYEFAPVGNPLNYYVSINLVMPSEVTLTKNFVNCTGYVVGSGGVLSPLPTSYTQNDLQNPYTCRFYASEGYYFDNRSIAANITQSGGIVITDVVFDVPLNNDRYTTGFSCSITLPLADCSLSAVANSMTYTITSELNRCSVSGLPATYTNEIEGTYVFIAAAGYGFNRNTISYEITGATYEVSYSGVLYGDFCQNLTISLEAHFSNVSIRVTAVSYDPVPYQQGYQDGYGEGYAQGKIAGDSYGVWNWLKQAARTTGEFLNITLLPGFSIGGLLTALAGLVIIWLFIKGFLFKS